MEIQIRDEAAMSGGLLATRSLAAFCDGQIHQRLTHLIGRLHQVSADTVDGRLGHTDGRANGLLGHPSLAETLNGG